MNDIIKKYLFQKKVLVADTPADPDLVAECVITLGKCYGIVCTHGSELLSRKLLEFVETVLPYRVPWAFYQGFPESVKHLNIEEKIFDQLVHYMRTYGFGNFNTPGYSLFDTNFKRAVFDEDTEPTYFTVVTEDEAARIGGELLCGLLASSRPISEDQFSYVLAYRAAYGMPDARIGSKDTARKLLLETGDISYSSLLSLSDVIGFVELLNYKRTGMTDIKKLNLKNQDRKLISAIIDNIFTVGSINEDVCYEKRDLWCGLLHHIHYKPSCEAAERFVSDIRSGKCASVYSDFERLIAEGKPDEAAMLLSEKRGGAAVLRKLNYLVSRTTSEEQIICILDAAKSKNAIVLIQLLLQYAHYDYTKSSRSFSFNRFGMRTVHLETEDEVDARKSRLNAKQVRTIINAIYPLLENALRGRIGKVYIDPAMMLIAPPISEGTSMGGYGVLPKGSRIPFDATDKKLRAFTYWEEVDDIDLSCMAVDNKGELVQAFYWATMSSLSENSITFSGDQTSGYEGGSEFFDFELRRFREEYPKARYVVFCNNVYSDATFAECVCRAGYMLRDIKDSGEIYEPKTVKTSFVINCDSSSAFLFAIDLEREQIVWLNAANSTNSPVAINQDFTSLRRYFDITDTINLKNLFTMLATETVSSPDEADVIVSDRDEDVRADKQIIRSHSFEAILKLIN